MSIMDADLIMVSGNDPDEFIDLNEEINKFEKQKRLSNIDSFLNQIKPL